MSQRFQRLFDPISVGNVRLKNRIAMAPMAVDYMVNPDGSLNQRVVDYYLERVRNDVGMIICSLFKVENKIEALDECTPQITESSLGYLGDLCDAAHSYGAKVFVQLTAGYGRVTVPSTLRGPCVSASALPNFWDPGITCRALATEEVEQIVQAMGMAADTQLYDDLSERVDCAYALGDCREPKNIMNAVWDAYEIARAI